jgi:tetratricopeptide (TPR) repeat protein
VADPAPTTAPAKQRPASAEAAPESTAPVATPSPWRSAWQFPLLALGLAGIVGAIYFAKAHPPKDDFPGALAQAEELVEKGEIDAARTVLFDVIAKNLEKAPPEVLPRFHAVSADFVAAQLRGTEKPARENDEQVVAAYDTAKKAGWKMTPPQLVRYAQSLVRLGRAQDAFAAISEAGDERSADLLRRQVRRDALLGVLEGGSGGGATQSPEALLAAIEEFRADPSLPAADEAWAAARAAEIRIALGRFVQAADRLLIDLRRIEGAAESDPVSPAAFAELSGLLGEALRRQGRYEEAEREFLHAHALSVAGTPVAGAIDVGLGRTLLALGRHSDAERVFDRAALAEHRGGLRHASLLGRAQSRAYLGEAEDAVRDFRALRTIVHRGEVAADVVDEIELALVDHADAALLAEHPGEALEYAEIAADLRPGRAGSAAALLRVATASREEADRMLAALSVASTSAGGIDPEERARINRLLKRAGDAFAAHAATPEARGSQDGALAASLWAAADSYDLAGWRDAALASFRAFLDAAQAGDLRRAEAYWRVASLNHAEGAYGDAVKDYERAIEVAPNGPFAVRSIVPLARALASSGRAADALQRLQGVIDGSFGLEPSADEYHEALDVLARLAFERGDFARSAGLLREAIARGADSPRLGELNNRLGASLREVAREARDEARTGDVSVARRAELEREAVARLAEARQAYEAAIAFDEPRAGTLDGLARDMLRDAHLSRAHCVFDAGDFAGAIPLYEAVDRKYPDHAVSMVALIQIVNCCDQLGDAVRAETAHRRAQLRLAQLPDEAFLAGGGILERQTWERWLRNRPPAGGSIASGATAPAEGAQP